MSRKTVVQPLDLGYFVRPASETSGLTARVEPAIAYLVRHPRGTLLFDSGIGAGSPETDAHYRPRRRGLREALSAAGARVADIDIVVNCHLHFDHCGGNRLFPGAPLLVQRTELAAARRGGYTIDALVDFPGAVYEELDGEAEPFPGVHVVPTPGHTDGHQSLVVRRSDGTAVVLAGQAYDTASDYAADELARRAAEEGGVEDLPGHPAWLDRLADFAPRRVHFAHDHAVWEAPRVGRKI
ncbi:N-acyl homoserine lactonase family protein [Streptomyces sp. URMC 126]|uniref:N-acyl homoserine lactonase family protein n=1 Tax=Streptomyces sp. URMC 126 TaxID=3423401 RepID=UPI003F1C7ECE